MVIGVINNYKNRNTFRPVLPNVDNSYAEVAGLPDTAERIISPRRQYAAAWIGKNVSRHAERALLITATDNPTDIRVDAAEWSAGIMSENSYQAVRATKNIDQKSLIIMDSLWPGVFLKPCDAFNLLEVFIPKHDFDLPEKSFRNSPLSTFIKKYDIL